MPLALALAAVLVYARTFAAGYIWDDDFYVYNNATLKTLGGIYDIWFRPLSIPQYYPLVHTTYWLEYRLWGDHPAGYHVVNVFLHAANAVLLWLVLRIGVTENYVRRSLCLTVAIVGFGVMAWRVADIAGLV